MPLPKMPLARLNRRYSPHQPASVIKGSVERFVTRQLSAERIRYPLAELTCKTIEAGFNLCAN